GTASATDSLLSEQRTNSSSTASLSWESRRLQYAVAVGSHWPKADTSHFGATFLQVSRQNRHNTRSSTNTTVRRRSSILASNRTKSEPRRLKSWALLVEMGESRTPLGRFILVCQYALCLIISGFVRHIRSSTGGAVRRRCCQNCCLDT